MKLTSLADQVAGRTLTDYEREQMMLYGACPNCGGPVTGILQAELHKAPPSELSDIELRMFMRCLWCGTER